MKSLLIIATTALFASFTMDQVNDIQIEEYSVQIRCHQDSLEFLRPPAAFTECENGGLTVSHSDAKFSGGALGTMQREWLYVDSCGNEGKAVQYVALQR